MASLVDLPEIVGFFSYSREDDEDSEGRLSALRDRIERELSGQLGRSRTNFRLWQDQEAIAFGELWESKITQAVEQAVFFTPIITPRAVNSPYCKFEFDAFLAREHALGRADLVFPLLYIGVPALEDEEQWRKDPVLSIIGSRQYVDWRGLRHRDVREPAVREAIEGFCEKIVQALRKPWVSPEERRKKQEIEAQQRVDAARQAEEEKRRAEAARQVPRIAIIYRREDSAVITARIFDGLVAHYGAGSVLRDGDNIPLGVGFREYINTMLVQTDIALVVVGKRWLGPLPRRRRRIDDPSDPVRVEIETALRIGMPVVPLLVDGGTMPNVDQLPDSLKEFVYRNGLGIGSGRDFENHLERLIRSIGPILPRRAKEPAEVSTPAEEESQQADTVRWAERERERLADIDAQIEKLASKKEELQNKLTLGHFTNPVEYQNVLQYIDSLSADIDSLRHKK